MDSANKDTATRILDAAERLFVEHGFEATSLRTITQQAEVNLAAVNYHFGSKDALFQAVLVRRLAGGESPGGAYCLSSRGSALRWPPPSFLLLLPQYQPDERDDNRPI